MRTRERFIWAALIVAWMGVIFWFSAQSGENSAALSGGIVEWAAHLIRPGLDQMPQTERQAFLDSLSFFVRKGAHFFRVCCTGSIADWIPADFCLERLGARADGMGSGNAVCRVR